MRGIVTLRLGEPVEVKASIGLAIAIEDATGKGTLPLSDAVLNRTAMLRDTAAILRECYKHAGRNDLADKVHDLIADHGLVTAQLATVSVLNAFFATPETEKRKTPAKAGAGKPAGK
jgi:hypothetical protein